MKMTPTTTTYCLHTTATCCEEPQNDDCAATTLPASPVASRRSVSFALEEQQVCYVDRDAEVDAASWYTPSDFKALKRSCLVTLKMNKAGKVINQVDYTMRGLECRTSAAMAERKQLKRNALQAVLEAQEQGLDIAKAYQAVTVAPQYQATVQGMVDELEARNLPQLAMAVSASKHSGSHALPQTQNLQGIVHPSSYKIVSGAAA